MFIIEEFGPNEQHAFTINFNKHNRVYCVNKWMISFSIKKLKND